MARNGNILQYEDNPTGPALPNPFVEGSRIDLGAGKAKSPISISADGFIRIERADGSVTIDTNPDGNDDQATVETKFNDNLAEHMDDMALASLSAEIMEGIEADLQSRQEWMDIRSKGMKMLALKTEDPKSDVSDGGIAPVEGQSRVWHTLLLEATVAFQAGARGELLPSSGPVKVKNMTPSAAPPDVTDSMAPTDELANALEVDFNHYLTDIAREYVPDTDRMFFSVGYGGDAFKKGYHCPLRRRPVLESIDAEDLIVSNAATDLSNCARVTQRLKMRKSVFRRMQLIGAYRDIDIQEPALKPADEVQQLKAEIGGYKPDPLRRKDADLEIYETYVEFDLPKFAPRHLKNKGLPLSYKVSIETTTKKILEIRRNWREDDREAKARQTFVQYPFIRGIGFYGLGFVHLLGNVVMALTAAYRLMFDAGMFANFPAFIYDKAAGRQLTNQFRAPLGGGIPLDVPSNKTIDQVAKPLPYKEVGPAWPAFVQHMEDRAKQLAMVTNASIGEGKQDAPVGTTLALIEQATKVEASAFKRLHDAQADEFRLLKELFREDPEAMWRHVKGTNPSGYQWQKAQFKAALESYELVPVADPNNPSALHRAMKSAMLKMLAMQNPTAYDMVAVDKRVLSMANIDPQGIFKPPQQGQGPDPIMMAMQMRQQMQQLQMQLRQQDMQLKAALAIQDAQGKAADRASRERIEKMKMQIAETRRQEELLLERMKMQVEALAHVHDLVHTDRQAHHDRLMDHAHLARENSQAAHQQGMDQAGQAREDQQTAHQQNMDVAGHGLKAQQAAQPQGQPKPQSVTAKTTVPGFGPPQ